MLPVIIVIQWRQSWWICWCERWARFVYPSHCSGRTTRPNWTSRVASLMVVLIMMVMVMVMVKIMSKFLILKARIEIWTSGGRKITCGVSGVVEQDEKEEELCFLDKYICLSEKRYFFCTKIFFLWKSRDVCFFLLKRKCCEKLLQSN